MTVKESTKEFETKSYFRERDVVTAAIKENVRSAMAKEGLTVESLYIGQMGIPWKFEDAVTTKVVTQQQAATVLMERNVTLVEAETEVIEAQAAADAAVTIGKSTALAYNLTESANAYGVKIIQKAGAEGLSSLGEMLDLEISETLTYKYSRLLSVVGEKKNLVIGYDDAKMMTFT
jgi:regulator of protease activity HflC (stomatin/prohibitin superfamily)